MLSRLRRIYIFLIFTTGIGNQLWLHEQAQCRISKPLTVAFWLQASYELDHFGPVCMELNKKGINAYFVLLKPKFPLGSKAQKKQADFNALLSQLKLRGYPYKHVFEKEVNVAITSQAADWLKSCKGLKIKMGYGPATLKNYFDSWYYEGFDGFLVHGKIEEAIFYPYFGKRRVKAIGLPKYDFLYQKAFDKSELRKKYGVATNAKVITYLPTWDSECSIRYVYESLRKLQRKGYTIVVKPHPHSFTRNNENHHLDQLKALKGALIIDCYEPFTDAVLMADLLITDIKSGATLEALFASKANLPWIGLFHSSDNIFHERVLKAGPILKDGKNLVITVEELLKNDPYQHKRQHLLPIFCGVPDGKDSARAVEAILNLAEQPVISKNYPYFWKKLFYSFQKNFKRFMRFFIND